MVYDFMKLSPGLRTLLTSDTKEATIQYVIMLNLKRSSRHQAPQNRENRGEILRERSELAESLLKRVDETLLKFGGRRLSGKVDPFGNVVIESSPDALRTFAQADYVAAILENSPLLQKQSLYRVQPRPCGR